MPLEHCLTTLQERLSVKPPVNSDRRTSRREALMKTPTPDTPIRPLKNGCPVSEVREKLHRAGLRPTRQRISLGWLLFSKGDRHVTAEMLFDEVKRARVPITLATVYNTLNQFSKAGLLRQIPLEGRKTYFDTNVTEHNHFLIEEDDLVMDIQGSPIPSAVLDAVPDGYEITQFDIVVRLKRIQV
jgi:Fur family transcriptional regulator, iron response regulator